MIVLLIAFRTLFMHLGNLQFQALCNYCMAFFPNVLQTFIDGYKIFYTMIITKAEYLYMY